MKKKLFKKSMALVLTGVLALSVLGGCGNKEKESSTDTAKTESSETENHKKVTLKLITWTNEATTKVLDELDKKFSEKYPYITIEMTAVDSATYPQLVQTRVAAADVDIIAQQQFVPNPDFTKGLDTPVYQQYIDNGDFLDLTDQDFIKNYDANAVADSASYNGKVYAIPMSRTSYNGVFYNKKMFADNNLEVPQTWDEFINCCETLKNAGIAPMTIAGKDGWPVSAFIANTVVDTVVPDMSAYVKGLWEGTTKLNDANGLEIFKRCEQIASYCENGVMGIDYASVPGRFAAGKTAMLADGAWQAPQIKAANDKLDFGYFPLPPTQKGDDIAQLKGKYDTLFAGSGKSKNKDAILKWLAFMSEEENYKIFIDAVAMESTMPNISSNNEFLATLAPISKDFQLQFEHVYRAPKGIGKYGGFQAAELKSLGGSVKTPEELADLAQKDWDDALNKVK